MENQINRMKELKSSREKSVKKLTKVLNTLVNLEWEVCSVASKTNDNISKLAIKSISESASCIQTAISKLILNDLKYVWPLYSKTPNSKSGVMFIFFTTPRSPYFLMLVKV